MGLLVIALIVVNGLALGVVLIAILSPTPFVRPALRWMMRALLRLAHWIVSLLRRRPATANSEHERRIAALETRNAALEAQLAELTICIPRLLSITMRMQEHLEAQTGSRAGVEREPDTAYVLNGEELKA